MSDLKIIWFLRVSGCSGGFSGKNPIPPAVWMHSAEVDALFRIRNENIDYQDTDKSIK
jgi:hypothetical protein